MTIATSSIFLLIYAPSPPRIPSATTITIISIPLGAHDDESNTSNLHDCEPTIPSTGQMTQPSPGGLFSALMTKTVM